VHDLVTLSRKRCRGIRSHIKPVYNELKRLSDQWSSDGTGKPWWNV